MISSLIQYAPEVPPAAGRNQPCSLILPFELTSRRRVPLLYQPTATIPPLFQLPGCVVNQCGEHPNGALAGLPPSATVPWYAHHWSTSLNWRVFCQPLLSHT